MTEDTTTTATLQTLQDDLREMRSSQARIERAVVGDPTVGHVGLVDRMLKLENLETKAYETHDQMTQDRVAGDKRVHERIDALEKSIAESLKTLIDEQRTRDDTIERKIDRFIWVILGTGIGSAAAGFGGAWALLA